MSNVALGYPNQIDDAVLSGGNWILPLTKLQDRIQSRVARSADLLPESTTFTIDLRNRYAIRCFALANHSMTIGARYSVLASNNADMSSPVFSRTYSAWRDLTAGKWDINKVRWENSNFWLGSTPQKRVAGRTRISMRMFPEDVSARYVKISITDRANPAGFLDIGRVFIGGVFLQPRINNDWKATLGYEDPTKVDASLSGVEYFDPRPVKPVARFQLSALSDQEGFSQALELTAQAGIHGEILYFADPDDQLYGSTRNFLGRLRTLNPMERSAFRMNSMAFEIKGL